ncbi:MAG: hypothetical protein GC161_12815 [Planctomycetaceae bacterium]|nr:hypothetical protein [Planctomycetaceae bacterium]
MSLWPIVWERPIALALLPLWLALWWFLRQEQRRPEVWSGAIEFWRAVSPESTRDVAREGRLTPRWIVWALAGLGLGTIALAGPRGAAPGPARVLHLHLQPGGALWIDRDDPAGRWQRARQAIARQAAALEPEPSVWLWHDGASAPLETEPDGSPPQAFLERLARSAAPFAPPDRADALWVQAAAPDPKPLAAGWVATGGDERAGPVGWDRGGWVHLEGGQLVPESGGAARPRWEPTSERSWIGDFARLWAADRGLATEGDGPLVLSVRSLPAPALASDGEVVGRDGWSAAVTPREASPSVAPLDGKSEVEVWLAASRGPLLARAPGQVAWAHVEWSEPRGDPAQVALSFADFFDGALAAPPEMASPEARADQGEAGESAPRWDLAAYPDPSRWQRGALTALAALVAALALLRAATLAPR